jgi:hypothetical protein
MYMIHFHEHQNRDEQKFFLNNSLYKSHLRSLSTDIHNNYQPIITTRRTHMHNASIGASAAASTNNKGNGNWRSASSQGGVVAGVEYI